MSAKLPDGAIFSIGTALAAAKPTTAATNALPPVLTSAAHGVTAADFILVNSGWSGLNDRVFKPTAPTADTIGLPGADSTNTARYPAGSGIGSFRKITAWQQVTQVLGWEMSGGDRKMTDYEYLEDDFGRQLPGSLSPQSITVTIADDITLAGYAALKAASDAGVLTPARVVLRDGSMTLYSAIIALNESPMMTKGQVVAVKAVLSLQAPPVRA